MDAERLLAEVEEVLQTIPPRETIFHDTQENLSWFGRAVAVVSRMGPRQAEACERLMSEIHSQTHARARGSAFSHLMTLLHQGRHEMRMAVGRTSVVVDKGRVFDYFDGLRKVIQEAQVEVFFVDPYLDAEFVSHYLPHVRNGVTIRLLAREKLNTLLPAVDRFGQQSNIGIQVRSIGGFHDRYLFVDQSACYQSGASFKDGAKNAPTTLTQITDAFQGVWETYDRLWKAGKVER